MPDTAKYNPDLDEYDDSAHIEWDSDRQEYIFVPFYGAPGPVVNGGVQLTMSMWLKKYSDPNSPLHPALMLVPEAEAAYFEKYPDMMIHSFSL